MPEGVIDGEIAKVLIHITEAQAIFMAAVIRVMTEQGADPLRFVEHLRESANGNPTVLSFANGLERGTIPQAPPSLRLIKGGDDEANSS